MCTLVFAVRAGSFLNLTDMDLVQRAAMELHHKRSPVKPQKSGNLPGAAPGEASAQAAQVSRMLSVMEGERVQCCTSPESKADAALHAYLASTALGTWCNTNEDQRVRRNNVTQVFLPS